MYNFLTDNCHCFVAHFLNDVAYSGSKDWNSISLVRCTSSTHPVSSLQVHIDCFAAMHCCRQQAHAWVPLHARTGCGMISWCIQESPFHLRESLMSCPWTYIPRTAFALDLLHDLSAANASAGHHGVVKGAACELVGGSQDLAALLHHHGPGLGIWHLEICPRVGLWPLPAPAALVHLPNSRSQAEGNASQQQMRCFRVWLLTVIARWSVIE